MIFSPTYLYIKQHTITGKMYFGKTSKSLKHLLKYTGSGHRWKRHINMHGKENVVTLWYHLYDNPFDLVADALSFSYNMNIVNSETFLNLKIENGLDGNPLGNIVSQETRQKQSIIRLGKKTKPASDETKRKISIANKGKCFRPTSISIKYTNPEKWEETKKKLSIVNSKENNPFYGKKHSEESKIKSSKTKSKLHDFMLPNGEILHCISVRQLCNQFNLKWGSVKKYFSRGASYKGYMQIYTYIKDIQN
jgi:hypothetical protein